jgi:hypothetical protein
VTRTTSGRRWIEEKGKEAGPKEERETTTQHRGGGREELRKSLNPHLIIQISISLLPIDSLLSKALLSKALLNL